MKLNYHLLKDLAHGNDVVTAAFSSTLLGAICDEIYSANLVYIVPGLGNAKFTLSHLPEGVNLLAGGTYNSVHMSKGPQGATAAVGF